MKVDGDQALARVRADRGRDPTDRLEAAVVLERSGGLLGDPALALGAEAFARCPAEVPPWGTRRIDPDTETPTIASVALVLVSLLWASTLGRDGALVDPTSALVCLPIGLGLVGYLDRCYFGGPQGPARTRSHPVAVLALVAGACGIVVAVAPGVSGPGVVVVLVVAAAATRFGLVVPVIGFLLVGVVASRLGVPGHAAAFGSLALAAGLVARHVGETIAAPVAPGSTRLGLLRAAAGAGVGLLTMPVIAHTIDLALSEPLLLILPATLGGALAATRLERVWEDIPDVLRGTVATAEVDAAIGRRYRWLVLSGAFVGAAVTAVVSVLVLVIDDQTGVAGVLVALAAIAAQGYAITVLHGVATEVEVAAVSVGAGVIAAGAVILGADAVVAVPIAVVAAHLVWVPLIVQVARDPEQVIAGQL